MLRRAPGGLGDYFKRSGFGPVFSVASNQNTLGFHNNGWILNKLRRKHIKEGASTKEGATLCVPLFMPRLLNQKAKATNISVTPTLGLLLGVSMSKNLTSNPSCKIPACRKFVHPRVLPDCQKKPNFEKKKNRQHESAVQNSEQGPGTIGYALVLPQVCFDLVQSGGRAVARTHSLRGLWPKRRQEDFLRGRLIGFLGF